MFIEMTSSQAVKVLHADHDYNRLTALLQLDIIFSVEYMNPFHENYRSDPKILLKDFVQRAQDFFPSTMN